MRDHVLAFRAVSSFKRFLKFWRVGTAYYDRTGQEKHCLRLEDEGAIKQCCNELTFYEWIRDHGNLPSRLTQYIPQVYEVSRESQERPKSDDIFELDAAFYTEDGKTNTAWANEVYPSPKYAYVLMEYLEGVTLSKLYEQSQTTQNKAMYARMCFRQIHETLRILHEYEWFHKDLHDDQYILSNGRWYLLDFGRMLRPTSKGYPTSFPWATWEEMAWEMFSKYLYEHEGQWHGIATVTKINEMQRFFGDDYKLAEDELWTRLVFSDAHAIESRSAS